MLPNSAYDASRASKADRGPQVFGVDGAPRRPEPGRGEFGRVYLSAQAAAAASRLASQSKRAALSPRGHLAEVREASMLPRAAAIGAC